MAKLRRDTHDTIHFQQQAKPLRIVASGTLFLTYTLSVPNHPGPSGVVRAHAVEKTRGGSANTILSLLAQFPTVEAVLVASLGGDDEGRRVVRELESEGVITRHCKVRENAGVPSAWIMHSTEDGSRAVVNHNPLPDITHEEFVSLLGPLLAPENYQISTISSPAAQNPGLPSSYTNAPSLSQSSSHPGPLLNPNSPAPFDWLHFEGRSVKTTMINMTGVDGLARDRKWRSHCVFSVDVGRRGRQGVEALIPYADVLFLNKAYAETISPHYASTPRAFLLSLTSIASSHSLLVAHWGKGGAAVLSLPTKEYFQSSGWVEERSQAIQSSVGSNLRAASDLQSVRSGSDFWADGRSRTPNSSASFTLEDGSLESPSAGNRRIINHRAGEYYQAEDDDGCDSHGTEMRDYDGVIDEVGAQDAFVAGMIYALSRRLLPGAPYTPSWTGRDKDLPASDSNSGRWRLDECLRFATELSGRKARRKCWDGLADEMTKAGWFDI